MLLIVLVTIPRTLRALLAVHILNLDIIGVIRGLNVTMADLPVVVETLAVLSVYVVLEVHLCSLEHDLVAGGHLEALSELGPADVYVEVQFVDHVFIGLGFGDHIVDLLLLLLFDEAVYLHHYPRNPPHSLALLLLPEPQQLQPDRQGLSALGEPATVGAVHAYHPRQLFVFLAVVEDPLDHYPHNLADDAPY